MENFLGSGLIQLTFSGVDEAMSVDVVSTSYTTCKFFGQLS